MRLMDFLDFDFRQTGNVRRVYRKTLHTLWNVDYRTVLAVNRIKTPSILTT